ncbi:MAG: hypothetical protein K0R55_2460 [Sporomusa sp.]|jgi:hypothetical protein|nr:hypothetical protein [Sporomusa sp.]
MRKITLIRPVSMASKIRTLPLSREEFTYCQNKKNPLFIKYTFHGYFNKEGLFILLDLF